MTSQPFRFDFGFTAPSRRLCEFAGQCVNSPDERLRAVAKAVLDVTHEAAKIVAVLSATEEETETVADLGPYFDFWFADAADAAKQLLASDDPEVVVLAEWLLDAEKKAIAAKESYLREAALRTKPPRQAEPWDRGSGAD